MNGPLTQFSTYEKNDNHTVVHLNGAHRVLSSAVYNGGFCEAEHLVNMKVPRRGKITESPRQTLRNYCNQNKWDGNSVGMMTAASMDSLRIASRSVSEIEVSVIVTCGLSNPRRAGDKADCNNMFPAPAAPGTINIIAVCSAGLTDAAMVEALMIITEAKAAALQDCAVFSSVSGKTATGTGTDSTAVASYGTPAVEYCGKHMLLGEIFAKLTHEALSSSLKWYRGLG